jgi:hypothetical protein
MELELTPAYIHQNLNVYPPSVTRPRLPA